MSAVPQPEQSAWFVIHDGIAAIPVWGWDSTQPAILGIPARADVNKAFRTVPSRGTIIPGLYLTFMNGRVLSVTPLFAGSIFEAGPNATSRIAAATYAGEANRTFDPTTHRTLPFVTDVMTLETLIREVAGLPSWTREDLIAQYIQQNPYRPGIADAVVASEGVPVWALAGAVMLTDALPAEVADGYEIPLQAMHAALAYYQRHRAVIDARIAANDIFAA